MIDTMSREVAVLFGRLPSARREQVVDYARSIPEDVLAAWSAS